MNYQREIAGIFAGIACLFLLGIAANIIDVEPVMAMAIIAIAMAPIEIMLAFFIGEKNGEKKARAD